MTCELDEQSSTNTYYILYILMLYIIYNIIYIYSILKILTCIVLVGMYRICRDAELQ